MVVFEFEVVDVSGYCPVYDVGDKMIVDGARLVMNKNNDFCNYALMSLKKKVTRLAEFEDDFEMQIKCMEKCAEFSTGGFVVFSCKQLEEAVL